MLFFTLIIAILDVDLITDDVLPSTKLWAKIIIYYITLDTNIIDSFDSK